MGALAQLFDKTVQKQQQLKGIRMIAKGRHSLVLGCFTMK